MLSFFNKHPTAVTATFTFSCTVAVLDCALLLYEGSSYRFGVNPRILLAIEIVSTSFSAISGYVWASIRPDNQTRRHNTGDDPKFPFFEEEETFFNPND